MSMHKILFTLNGHHIEAWQPAALIVTLAALIGLTWWLCGLSWGDDDEEQTRALHGVRPPGGVARADRLRPLPAETLAYMAATPSTLPVPPDAGDGGDRDDQPDVDELAAWDEDWTAEQLERLAEGGLEDALGAAGEPDCPVCGGAQCEGGRGPLTTEEDMRQWAAEIETSWAEHRLWLAGYHAIDQYDWPGVHELDEELASGWLSETPWTRRRG
jgi:hypothetical protein